MIAGMYKSTVFLLLMTLTSCVRGEEEVCEIEEYKAADNSLRPGIYISRTTGTAEHVYTETEVYSYEECFEICCNMAVDDLCDAASYYKTSNGTLCYLMKCGSPFSQCVWGQTWDENDMAGFVMIVDGQINEEQEKILEELEWNFGNTPTVSPQDQTTPDSDGQKTTASNGVPTTVTPDGFQPLVPAGAQAGQSDSTGPNETPGLPATGSDASPDLPSTANDASPDLPVTGSDKNAMIPSLDAAAQAQDPSAVLSDLDDADQLGAVADDQFSDNGELFDSPQYNGMPDEDDFDDDYRVNLPVLFVCLATAFGVVILAGIFIFRRISAERDRTVYRPLMDDLRAHGYGETSPLH